MAEKPRGVFQCVACRRLWHGHELYRDPMTTGIRWTCGDLMCGANVVEVKPRLTEGGDGGDVR